jgi:signal transduction histidine kinase/DNA-binding response OmpR family regulator
MLNSRETVVKMKKNVFFVIVTALAVGLFFCAHLSASPRQNNDIYSQNNGFKYLENYNPKPEAKTIQPQNWCVIQDKQGVIYVGNNSTLLEFDGVSWRVIDIPNFTVYSMAVDKKGILYIGGNNEIGFFTKDLIGVMKYTSLKDHLKDKHRNFSQVWNTLYTKEGVYFHTSRFLYRWDFKQIKVWESKHLFNKIFTYGGKFFVLQRPVGLMQMVSDSLKLIPGGDAFSQDKIYMIAPYDDQTMLIGTRSKGFYLYDGTKPRPFPTEVDGYLIKNKVYKGIRLKYSPRDFALVTRGGGLVIIDYNGNLKGIFDKTSGLQDDNVKYVFEDSQGNLWLALEKGISKIEYAAPFSVYDDRCDLPGLVLAVVKHDKLLYAGTTRGLYFLSSANKFRPVSGISSDCRCLLSIGKSLLEGTIGGVFLVENDAKKMIINNRSYALSSSKKDTHRVWVGTDQGLLSLYFRDSQWIKELKFKNITQEIRTIVEDKKGNLWLGTPAAGVLKVDFPRGGVMINPVVTRYHTSEGLPTGEINVFMAAKHVIFASKGNGIYRFESEDKKFIPDFTLGDRFSGGSRGVFRIVQDQHNHIWFHSENVNFRAIPGDNGFNVPKDNTLLMLPIDQANEIYPDPGGDVVWFACNKGLICFDTRKEKDSQPDFFTLIREVEVNGTPLFYDIENIEYKPINKWKDSPTVIAFKDRNIIFRYAAPFFEGESRTQYRCFLEGYDEHWSDWILENRKEYTNLDPGLKTFRVQANNIYENLSKEAVFQFRVLPPWYKTWWAFSLYVITGFLGLILVVRLRSGKLQREKQKLEQIVKERTREINYKNSQLKTQTLQLKEQANKLKEMSAVKSRFFANISHEFRTPLTLIMGPLEQILSDYRDKDSQLEKKVKLMLRNSQRLFTLINRLLDLSKLDSGKMQLKAGRQNIIPFLKGIVASFDLLSSQYDLDLTFQAREEDITLYFDLEKMEDVMGNLLINAVKFTPGGGKITVSAKRIPTKEEHFPAGYLEISVSDTGPGIPREQLANIFERFYQSDSTYEHHQKGTGIGLALTRELIHLHHGKIDVHSRKGENSGTEFIIQLSLGKEYLKPHEIVTPDEIPPECRKPFEISAAYMVEKEGDVPEDVKAGQVGSGELEKEIDPLKTEKDIILVVEDSADVREYIRGALEPLYVVVEAKDGQEGIRKAQKIVPDLIISDIMMPGVDGYELCTALKKDIKTSHVPIILLTAKASEESIIRGLETGADDYITKPFSTKLLMARIKNLIDLRRHFQLTLYREMTQQPVKMSLSQMDREFIKELQDMIEKNLSDPDFNVERLGKKLYMSRATLYRKIHALSGESPNEFLQSYRLKRGAELLENNFGSILEVAFEVGFSSASYFTKCFKKKFNRLPSDFQPMESK